MSGFTDWFSVNTIVGIVDYIISWYENLAGKENAGDISELGLDSDEEWGQFVVIDK